MAQFTVEQTTGEIVKIFPKASDIFRQRRIDFCCSGDRPLIEAITENSLDETTVLSELNTAYDKWQQEDHNNIDWDTLSLTELVDLIQTRYHANLEEELLGLNGLVTKVFRVHGNSQPQLKELYQLYNRLQTELVEHTIKEDNEVFPLIKEYENDPNESLLTEIHEANGTLEDEHDFAGDLLKQMRKITNDFTPPAGACTTFQLTYARLSELESETFDHIHLENNVLFKRL